MQMKLRHWIVAGTALVSATALAGGDKQRQTQSGEQPEQHAQSGAAQSQEVVKQAQQKLSQMGHDAGPADGIFGPKTQAALKEFQQAKGLNETGQLDSQTLAALQLSESAGAAGPSGPAGQPASGSMSQDRPSEPSASGSADTKSQSGTTTNKY
jgi:peptidoglycan hydrolase-like protein with peptidoglycan-binding domain